MEQHHVGHLRCIGPAAAVCVFTDASCHRTRTCQPQLREKLPAGPCYYVAHRLSAHPPPLLRLTPPPRTLQSRSMESTSWTATPAGT